MNYGLRRQRLAASFPESLQGVLVSDAYDIRYYTGFAGEGYVLISAGLAVIFTDARYIGLCRRQCPELPAIKIPGGAEGLHIIYSYTKARGFSSIGVDDRHLTVAAFSAMQSVFSGVFLCAAGEMIHFPRQIKSEDELDALRQAAQMADNAFLYALEFIEPGMSEAEIAAGISRYFLGDRSPDAAEGLSFPVMVASGIHSCLPHGPVTGRRIQSGDFVVMDFGCVCRGYCSDMTRTVVVGEPSVEQQRLYDAVLQAQRLAMAKLGPGVSLKAVQEHVESFFIGEGYGDYFLHMLCHGVGLCVHEEPLVSEGGKTDGGKDVLRPGMVLAVEPGLYIEGQYGVRIEDMVIVTEEGCDMLTNSCRTLQFLKNS